MRNLAIIKAAINSVNDKITDRVNKKGLTKEDNNAYDMLSDLRNAVMVLGDWSDVYAAFVKDEPDPIISNVHNEIKRLTKEQADLEKAASWL